MMIIFFGNLEIELQIQNLKLALLFFENFTVDFQISYFKEKKLSGQIVVCFSVSTYESLCFKEFCDFILGHGLDNPGLNRMVLKKDMRNDHLFFKRITDILIPDYSLSKNVQGPKRQVLTSFGPGEKLSINWGCSRKPQFSPPCTRK